jgi:cobaltochelatase CobT
MNQNNSYLNQTKEKLVTTIKNIAVDGSLQIEFSEDVKNNFFIWNQNLVFRNNVILPNITTISDQILSNDRAASDLAICYLLFHNHEIHQQKQRVLEQQKFFNDFEKIRVFANIKNSYLGVVKNILAKIEEDIYSDSENLSLILLHEIFADKLLPKTSNLVEELKNSLSKKILEQIKNLAKKTNNQSNFEKAVEKLLKMLEEEQKKNNESNEDQKQDQNQAETESKKENDINFAEENVEMQDKSTDYLKNEEEIESKIEEQPEEITDFKQDDEGGSVKIKTQDNNFKEEKIEFKNAYKIFTSKFDEIVFPPKLVSKNELQLLRDQLDLKMMKLDDISKKMTTKLKRKLMAKKNSYVEKDNNGVLDRKKLTRFILDPFMEDIWINNKESQYQDTALTILLDNSGSMRGQPIVMSALACEIIAGILEKFSIKTEIIGFTTADWKGGKARKMWEISGRTKNPGRLNELRHIIYKSSNQSFKKSKVNLGLMLKEGILKENIDGEALLFAKARLMQRDEKRKILMVISDGTPIDDSTNSANDEDILSDHLRHVINKIEKQSKIEIVGIGIGHSADDFYKNSITIKGLEELGDVMIEKLVGLL